MKKLNICIIGQWIYPLSNPRSNRTWQLALQLAREGHNVDLYALLGDFDYSSFEISNLHIHNLGISKLGLSNSSGKYKRTFVNRAVTKLVGDSNIYPGIEFFPMIKKVMQFIGDVDLLITIAYPHSIHWAMSHYLNKLKVKCWVADCGDPYMGDSCHNHFACLEKVERKWCNLVDYISIPIKSGQDAYYQEYQKKIRIIPQGFNFSEIKTAEYIKNDIPTFACCGTIYKGIREPTAFFDLLASEDRKMQFLIFSKDSFFRKYQRLRPDIFKIQPPLSHEQLVFELSKMDFLINFENKTSLQLPSKLIDYGLAQRPILSIMPDLNDYQIQKINKFLIGNYEDKYIVDSISDYNIINVANKFVELYFEKYPQEKV